MTKSGQEALLSYQQMICYLEVARKTYRLPSYRKFLRLAFQVASQWQDANSSHACITLSNSRHAFHIYFRFDYIVYEYDHVHSNYQEDHVEFV